MLEKSSTQQSTNSIFCFENSCSFFANILLEKEKALEPMDYLDAETDTSHPNSFDDQSHLFQTRISNVSNLDHGNLSADSFRKEIQMGLELL